MLWSANFLFDRGYAMKCTYTVLEVLLQSGAYCLGNIETMNRVFNTPSCLQHNPVVPKVRGAY